MEPKFSMNCIYPVNMDIYSIGIEKYRGIQLGRYGDFQCQDGEPEIE